MKDEDTPTVVLPVHVIFKICDSVLLGLYSQNLQKPENPSLRGSDANTKTGSVLHWQ